MNRLIHTAELFLQDAIQFVNRYPKQVAAGIGAALLFGTGATFAVATLAPDAADLPVRTILEDLTLGTVRAANESAETEPLRLYRSDVSRAIDTADTLLKRLGVFDPAAAAFMRSDALLRQNLLGRTGRNITVEASDSNGLLKLVARWSPDDSGNFKRLSMVRKGDNWTSALETVPLVASSRIASGAIQSSLFAATDSARIPANVADQLANIFEGDIDFHRALRKGDRFSVIYEALEGDGEPLRAGRVLSAEFVNAGKTYQALWFQDPTAAPGSSKGAYYTPNGDSLHRAYLASPMEFSRVTSGFKMRFHPILQTWRAHLGVDYAAPTGTPVRSVGNGVVDFAGVQNGFGNVVIVKHNNAQTTVYAHLSRINVKRGQSVAQSQTIGLVGATGWATGPHLHFEFRVNGAHKDPLTIARQSESIPLPASAKPAFAHVASEVKSQLAAASVLRPANAQ